MMSSLHPDRLRALALAALVLAGCSRWGFEEMPLDESQPFTWENPTPSGDLLYSVWGTSADDFVAVGNRGVVVRYDGQALSLQVLTPATNLFGVWGVDWDNVFAVGSGGKVFFFDGRQWAPMPPATNADLSDVFGFSASDVFAAGGPGGTVMHYNGAVWSRGSCGVNFPSGLWGQRREHLLLVASAGTLMSFDGQQWVTEPSFSLLQLTDIWGADESHLFVTGGPNVYRYDGTVWTTEAVGGTTALNAVSGTSANDVIVVGGAGFSAHWDGAVWQSLPPATPAGLRDVWISPEGVAVAVGDSGVVARSTGAAWEVLTGGWNLALRAVWSAADGTTFAADCGKILRKAPGGSWAEEVLPTGLPCIRALWGRSGTDVVAVGDGGSATLFDGEGWRRLDTRTTAGFTAVAGNADSFFAVGAGGTIWRCRGFVCDDFGSPTTSTLNGVWGDGETFFAVGVQGTIVRFRADGSATGMFAYTAETLGGVWGVSATDVFAVGSFGTILHYDGIAWSPMASPIVGDLSGVSGTGPNDVYAVGPGGMILRFNGAAWTQVTGTGAYQSLFRVHVNEAAQVWVVGDGGAILKKEHRPAVAQGR
jgi:hypothetical protein